MSLPPHAQVLLPAVQASPARDDRDVTPLVPDAWNARDPTEQPPEHHRNEAPSPQHDDDRRRTTHPYVPFTRRTRRGTPFQYDDLSHHNSEPSNALAISSQKIPKLNDKNYKIWCRDIEFILQRLGVWEIITDLTPTAYDRSPQWNDRNLLALSEILIEDIRSCSPPRSTMLEAPGQMSQDSSPDGDEGYPELGKQQLVPPPYHALSQLELCSYPGCPLPSSPPSSPPSPAFSSRSYSKLASILNRLVFGSIAFTIYSTIALMM